jgi:aspartate carbamoyltransferase catalytic subunit
VNGGWGAVEHPSQALLDAYTLWKHFGSLQGLKVLLMGDLRHSRVASSHWGLLRKLGCEVGSFGPPQWAPAQQAGIRTFDSRAEALQWADACMALRVQSERHQGPDKIRTEDYLATYGLSDEGLRDLRPSAVILHPGPVNRGVEISEKAYSDPRSKILEQVEGGLYVRMALFDFILNQRLLA